MRSGYRFLAAIGCAALAACATPEKVGGPSGTPRPLHCPGGNCDPIMVTVDEYGGGVCQPREFPDILLSGEDTGEKKITFVISGGSYRWSEDKGQVAFFLKPGSDNPTGKFGPINVTGADKKTLVVHFKHVKDPASRKVYRFGLIARRTVDGGPGPFCQALDPWLIS
jgi:hypothetical protein